MKSVIKSLICSLHTIDKTARQKTQCRPMHATPMPTLLHAILPVLCLGKAPHNFAKRTVPRSFQRLIKHNSTRHTCHCKTKTVQRRAWSFCCSRSSLCHSVSRSVTRPMPVRWFSPTTLKLYCGQVLFRPFLKGQGPSSFEGSEASGSLTERRASHVSSPSVSRHSSSTVRPAICSKRSEYLYFDTWRCAIAGRKR